MPKRQEISLKKVRVHNLKSVDLTLPKGELIVFSGVSGSGKSSLAFDTLYVEGQRRYVESLSTYQRKQMGDFSKPDMEHAEGVTPTISIEQKTTGGSPRSTVGTVTEIYDYLRVLFARVGIAHCPISGEIVMPQSRERIIQSVQSYPLNAKLILLAPYAQNKKGEFQEDFITLLRKGYTRLRVDGKIEEIENIPALDGTLAHTIDIVIDRFVVKTENFTRIAESVMQALENGKGICSVLDADTGLETLFSMHAYAEKSGISYPALEPHDFSFNSPLGMCTGCQGLGLKRDFDLNKIIDPEKSIQEDCCLIASPYATVRYGNIYRNLAKIYKFDIAKPWKDLPKKAQNVFLHGCGDNWIEMHFIHPIEGNQWVERVQWKGVLHDAHKKISEAKSASYQKKMQALLTEGICPDCQGERLKPYPRVATLGGKRIAELCHLQIDQLLYFMDHLVLDSLEAHIAKDLLREMRLRLSFLIDVGLNYLSLNRTAPTLSGGEAQRVRLSSQIGAGLIGITYILDEPSIGLHPRDNKKLIATLKHLRDRGNTVIVVEHDEETIRSADRVVDFGPGPGLKGGSIVYNGPIQGLLNHPDSLTGAYLCGRLSMTMPKKRRKINKSDTIKIYGAQQNNLKRIDVSIPLGAFTCITGLSGSGKSSLVSDILYPALSVLLEQSEIPVGKFEKITGSEKIDKVIAIDQKPIGRTPRSNPATYTKLFDEIRDLFTELPQSKARGYKSGRFSFNVAEGSCSACSGMGLIKIDMDFLEDIWVECPTCMGRRFDNETLSILYKEKNIYDVLEMEVSEAFLFFENIPKIKKKLQTLIDVGMEYIKLGQSATTLSGGEAQRIKLAKELCRPTTGRTLYILDEPTTGLHFVDINHLLQILHRLVDQGNTVVIIEHNMDVVKTADHVIDLGPDGGEKGGYIVGEGVPEKIAKMDTPTGYALKEAIKGYKIEETTLIPYNSIESIEIKGAEQNNLKNIDAHIPRGKMTVCCGPSGSGKSSFAFETVYAVGQRRYTDSLSSYARQFVHLMPKPRVASVEGLSPAIAIEQKAHAGNPRSTIGTQTEVYDYLRLLYARIGIPHCPETGERIEAISKEHIVDKLLSFENGTRVVILAPLSLKRAEDFTSLLSSLLRQGYLRIRLNGEIYDLEEHSLENIPFNRKKKNALYLVVDRLKIDADIQHRLAEAIENAARIGNQSLLVLKEEEELFFNLAFTVPSTGRSYPPITPQSFSFNSKEGYCPECEGLGILWGANLMDDPEFRDLQMKEVMQRFWEPLGNKVIDLFWKFMGSHGILKSTLISSLNDEQYSLLVNGSQEKLIYDSKTALYWVGLNKLLAWASHSSNREVKQMIRETLQEIPCRACLGTRIHALARHVTIKNKPIYELCALPVEDLYTFIDDLQIQKEEARLLEEAMEQIKNRLHFMIEVGLGYLSLNRSAPTLSGGEAQRIRLARQLGGGLTGVLYVLDEPTIGLHPKDNFKLNAALKKLKQLGNTLLLVEHDPLTIKEADYLLDFGPGAGAAGGKIISQGTLQEICNDPRSLTGAYLCGKKKLLLSSRKRGEKKNYLKIQNASLHNLKNINLSFPCGYLCCLTGVSGSGKSSLLNEIIEPAVRLGLLKRESIHDMGYGIVGGIQHFDRLIVVDQNPVGRTVRSDVGTYVDLLPLIRDFFARLPDARKRGLQPGNFSYNTRYGACSECFGLGYKNIDLHFLPSIKVECPSCHGMRINPLSLEVTYKEKNFGEYLKTTLNELRKVFDHDAKICRILDTLIDVGLGYLELGQEVVSLSGGEAQRIKLSKELAKRTNNRTLYLLDEPTTGLHYDDINKLLKVLNRLAEAGNTLIVIEHNEEFIEQADFVAELGPEAGAKGGELISTKWRE